MSAAHSWKYWKKCNQVGISLKDIDSAFIRKFKADLARDSFYDFIRAVKPDYEFNWHHIVLIEALQALANREYSRLIVMMPPRHGKSELVSRLFPAWCFARNVNEQVIVASYSLDLASAMNRDCQKVVTSDTYTFLFPDSRVATIGDVGKIHTTKRFDISTGKGYYVAAGVGGGITGVGATVGIIDDPVKNSEEADSQTYREKAHDWYKSTFSTRMEPGAIEVICQTRWHEDDLTGRILLENKPGTRVISMPALAEKADEKRMVGDSLWPSKYPRTALLERKETVGTRVWNSLFQQRPADEEGGPIKKAWFGTYDPRTFDLKGQKVNFYVDTAYTDKERNDPTGALAYVKHGADYYLLEFSAQWLEFNDQVKFVKDFAMRNGYSGSSIIRVEPKASGKSVVQVMKAGTALNIREAVSPKDSKTARVNSVSGVIEAGRVLLPSGMLWVQNFLSEVGSFPNAAHDEAVDCLTGMIINETQKQPHARFA